MTQRRNATPKQKDQLIAKIATALDPKLMDFDMLEDLLRLKPKFFSTILSFAINHSSAGEPMCIVDLDASPFVPEGMIVSEHNKGGSFILHPKLMELYLVDGQNGGMWGNFVYEQSRELWPFNANLLDHFLSHKEMIPPSFERFAKARNINNLKICFWGTVYHIERNNARAVRCLTYRKGNFGPEWSEDRCEVDAIYNEEYPVLAPAV